MRHLTAETPTSDEEPEARSERVPTPPERGPAKGESGEDVAAGQERRAGESSSGVSEGVTRSREGRAGTGERRCAVLSSLRAGRILAGPRRPWPRVELTIRGRRETGAPKVVGSDSGVKTKRVELTCGPEAERTWPRVRETERGVREP